MDDRGDRLDQGHPEQQQHEFRPGRLLETGDRRGAGHLHLHFRRIGQLGRIHSGLPRHRHDGADPGVLGNGAFGQPGDGAFDHDDLGQCPGRRDGWRRRRKPGLHAAGRADLDLQPRRQFGLLDLRCRRLLRRQFAGQHRQLRCDDDEPQGGRRPCGRAQAGRRVEQRRPLRAFAADRQPGLPGDDRHRQRLHQQHQPLHQQGDNPRRADRDARDQRGDTRCDERELRRDRCRDDDAQLPVGKQRHVGIGDAVGRTNRRRQRAPMLPQRQQLFGSEQLLDDLQHRRLHRCRQRQWQRHDDSRADCGHGLGHLHPARGADQHDDQGLRGSAGRLDERELGPPMQQPDDLLGGQPDVAHREQRDDDRGQPEFGRHEYDRRGDDIRRQRQCTVHFQLQRCRPGHAIHQQGFGRLALDLARRLDQRLCRQAGWVHAVEHQVHELCRGFVRDVGDREPGQQPGRSIGRRYRVHPGGQAVLGDRDRRRLVRRRDTQLWTRDRRRRGNAQLDAGASERRQRRCARQRRRLRRLQRRRGDRHHVRLARGRHHHVDPERRRWRLPRRRQRQRRGLGQRRPFHPAPLRCGGHAGLFELQLRGAAVRRGGHREERTREPDHYRQLRRQCGDQPELRQGRELERCAGARCRQLRQHRHARSHAVQCRCGDCEHTGLQLHRQADCAAEPGGARHRCRRSQFLWLCRGPNTAAQRTTALVECFRFGEERARDRGAGAVLERQRLGAEQR